MELCTGAIKPSRFERCDCKLFVAELTIWSVRELAFLGSRKEGIRLRIKSTEPRDAAQCTPILARFMHVAVSPVSSAVSPHLCWSRRKCIRAEGLDVASSARPKVCQPCSVSYHGHAKDNREASKVGKWM
jgi:hypothetical protein